MFFLKNEGVVWLSPSSPTTSLVRPLFPAEAGSLPLLTQMQLGTNRRALLPMWTASSSWVTESLIRWVSMLNSTPIWPFSTSAGTITFSTHHPLHKQHQVRVAKTITSWSLRPHRRQVPSLHTPPRACLWVVQDMVSVGRLFNARLKGPPWPPIQTKPCWRVAIDLRGHAKLVIWTVSWKMDPGASGCLPLSPLFSYLSFQSQSVTAFRHASNF